MNLKAKEGLSVSDMIVVGFALFSMFFGAGNTVSPYIGMESGTSWFTGFLMFFIGDCGLALMGRFAFLLRMGSTDAVFNRLGAPLARSVRDCLLCRRPVHRRPAYRRDDL